MPGQAGASVLESTLWTMAQDRTQALGRLDAVSEALRATTGSVQTDRRVRMWVRNLIREMFNLNLLRVYTSLDGPDGQRRWVGAVSIPEAGGLRVNHAIKPVRPRGVPLGVAALELGMSPTARIPGTGQPYGVEQRLGLALGDLAPQDLLGLVVEIIRRLEADPDTAVLARTLPLASAGLQRAVRMSVKRTPANAGTTGLRVRGVMDPAALSAAGYPELARVVSRWKGLGTFSAVVRNRAGQRLVLIRVQADPGSLELHWTSKDGQVIPTDGQGVAHLPGAWDLSSGAQRLTVHGSLDAQYEGIHLRMSDWVMPMQWNASSDGWGLEVLVVDAPRIRLEGDGAVRRWLLGIADASFGLTEHGQDLADAVAMGAGGEGTRLMVSIRRAPPSGWWLEQRFSTLLVDNAVIRFGFQLLGGRLVPSQAGLLEIGDLVGSIIDGALEDYDAVRATL